jgi:hypothetical protein
MPHIVLLSEIHPLSSQIAHKEGHQIFDPLMQAFYWHNIISPEDISGRTYNYIEIMQLILRRCAGASRQLVIRDMTNIDFIGLPSLIEPSYHLQHAKMLSSFFEVISFALVRHPVDLWLSQRMLPYLQTMPIDYFLKGYLAYAQQIQSSGFVRYEDFVKDPEGQMHIICDKLHLEFDRNFLHNWSSYHNITGDFDSTKSRGAGLDKIMSLPRRPVEADVLDTFRSKKEYRAALELLNYDDLSM